MLKYFLLGSFIIFTLSVYSQSNAEILPKIRLGFSSGVGYRLGKSMAGADDDYVKSIRFGPDINADATYFFSPSLGFGVKYSWLWSAGSTTSVPGIVSNIRINYLGPVLYYKANLGDKNIFLSGISLGLFSYKDDGWIKLEKTLIKGNTAGSLIEFAYDRKIYKKLFLGINTGVLGGVLSNISINNQSITLQKGQKESMFRIYGDVGLRFIR